MLSSHVIYMPRGSRGILHAWALPVTLFRVHVHRLDQPKRPLAIGTGIKMVN